LERPWELDLINNKKHGIDVNIFESIRRDAFNLGHKIDVEYELLMNEACIIGDEIFYPTKYVDTVYNIFQSRYKLNKNYYNNVFSVAFEQMIQ
jgi:HD superfamily phosphohydrolase